MNTMFDDPEFSFNFDNFMKQILKEEETVRETREKNAKAAEEFGETWGKQRYLRYGRDGWKIKYNR